VIQTKNFTQPAQPVQLNVYPVKSLLHLFLWGELLGIAGLFNRDEISVALISPGRSVFIRGGSGLN
jgi:hypothetical protein